VSRAEIMFDFLFGRRPHRRIAFKLGPVTTRAIHLKPKGDSVAKKVAAAVSDFVLTDIQQLPLSLTETDEAGNPVGTIPSGTTAVWTSSNPAILTVAPVATDPTGLTALVVTVGPLTVPGSPVQINVAVTLPGAASAINGTLPIDVIASAASSVAILPGTPTNRPGF
jgi:hypothetical protein